MSRTDHHAPDWVLALHAHADGRPTAELHGTFCPNRFDPYTGRTGPACDYTIRLVAAQEAIANDWLLAERWNQFGPRHDAHGSQLVYARVPEPPHPCDIDTGGSRCRRFVDYTDRRRRYRYTRRASRAEVTSGYFAPERCAVRDSLRDAVREANAGLVDDWLEWEPDASRGREVPVRQHRHAEWGGGWWD